MPGHDHLTNSANYIKPSIAEFMQRNLEKDPEFFVEPEDTPDYGPPGMPTPLVPMDARIAERQMHISDSLRGLLESPELSEYLSEDTIKMLTMNFDAHNTILGVANNGSYYRWTRKGGDLNLPAELQYAKEKAVLGLAQPADVLDLLLYTQSAAGAEDREDLKSAELMKLYHVAKYRMRHLEPRRREIKDAILERGGEVIDRPDFYDLKLFPYVVVTDRELTDDERRECHMLTTSAEKKVKLLTSKDTYRSLMTPELFEEITAEVRRDSMRVAEIMAGTQEHTIKGLMASVKRRIGVINKDSERDIRIVERQVFAVDITEFDEELIGALHKVRAIRDENEGQEEQKPTVDESTVAVYAHVYEEFKNSTDKILPVSTITYGYEKKRTAKYPDTVTGALAKIATQSSVSIS